MYDKMNGVGAHEVVIESNEHGKDFPDLLDKHAEDVVWAFRDRIMDLKKDPRFEYILVFKNKGAAAGASLTHPHSQLIATPVVPKHVRESVNGAKNYYEYKERCVFCDMIKQEATTGTRIVAENDDFVAFVPFAARFPFEVWILPKVHDSDFEDVQKHEVVNLTRLLQNVLRRMKNVLDNPPYNFIILNSPLRESKLAHYHWYLEIMPKLTKVAGFEWGSGFYINPTPPEEAAKFLREAD
jgi:UDPglucose--hexose-1-phosphate uridylyltransferase